MTLRQFLLLDKRHKEDLVHREMCAAFTSAAIYNVNRGKGSKPVAPKEFMPNYVDGPTRSDLTPEQRERASRFHARVVEVAALMKAGKPFGASIPKRQSKAGRTERRKAEASRA